ncbi:MAG TPA: ribbon-helix-helix domain-containing protein [Candidatus Lokiarchaeia archaeon]
MKIVTVNVPETYIEAIERLVGENGLYPSRSELIRCAVREFLIKELKLAKNIGKYDKIEVNDFDDENFVRIPVANKTKEEPVREFKTYKILKRLY